MSKYLVRVQLPSPVELEVKAASVEDAAAAVVSGQFDRSQLPEYKFGILDIIDIREVKERRS